MLFVLENRIADFWIICEDFSLSKISIQEILQKFTSLSRNFQIFRSYNILNFPWNSNEEKLLFFHFLDFEIRKKIIRFFGGIWDFTFFSRNFFSWRQIFINPRRYEISCRGGGGLSMREGWGCSHRKMGVLHFSRNIPSSRSFFVSHSGPN